MHFKSIHNGLCLVLLVIWISTATCHTMTDAKKLLHDKQMDYEKTFRPIGNQSAPVVLYTGLELVSIQEFDEVKETLTITAVVVLNWVDEYMKWEPTDYGGLKEFVIESDKVWTPNLVLVNNVDKLEKIGDAWQIIRFISDGIAFYYPGDVLSASCRVDVTYYPWDKHKCGFTFSAWAHSPSEVIFLPNKDKVQTTYFSENGAWTFYDSSIETFHYDSFIEFYLYLERKPRFVLVNVICPIIFMAFLNAMIFAIPVESGERISYSITVLLAIAVFLTLVGDNLPKTSSPMSFFSYYLLVVLIISICITLATIFNVRLYYRDDYDPVPGCLISVVRCVKCKRRDKKFKREPMYLKTIHRNGGRADAERAGSDEYRGSFGATANNYEALMLRRKSIYPPISNHSKFLSDPNSNGSKMDSDRNSDKCRQTNGQADSGVSWKDVSMAFDKIFFVVSFLVILIATVVYFLTVLISSTR